MSFSHGKHKLIGFVDLGEIHNHMSLLSGQWIYYYTSIWWAW